MARYSRLDLSVDEAAQLLHVQPETVRRRLRAKELRPGPGGGVRLSPGDDWLRVEDAAALLSVAPATVRSNIKRGRLVGRREEKGRWRVQLSSVLADRRCDGDARARFAGGDVDELDAIDVASTRPRRTGRPSRDVFVRLYDDEPELLERAVDRHGTQRQAVLEGLRALEVDHPSSADVAELRAEHELQAEQLERVRSAHRNLSAHARDRLVDEVYCHHCEQMIPRAELGEHELEDGTVELYHRKHGHRRGGKLRGSTVIARRGPLELADAD